MTTDWFKQRPHASQRKHKQKPKLAGKHVYQREKGKLASKPCLLEEKGKPVY